MSTTKAIIIPELPLKIPFTLDIKPDTLSENGILVGVVAALGALKLVFVKPRALALNLFAFMLSPILL